VPLAAPRDPSRGDDGRGGNATRAFDVEGACHTAVPGEKCYEAVLWAIMVGVLLHPSWYPTVTAASGFETFQSLLHETGHGGCPKPCAIPWSIPPFSPSEREPNGTVCNIQAAALNANDDITPMWNLTNATEDACFRNLLSKHVVKAPQREVQQDRNWCWAGLKEVGCHRHLGLPYTWGENYAFALAAGVTAKSPKFYPLRTPEICDRRELGAPREWTMAERRKARTWYQEHVATYVLTIARSIERQNRISARLQELDISFAFVFGIDLREESALQEALDEGLIPRDFNFSRAQAEANEDKNGMGLYGSILGTVGCAAGHFRAQKQALRISPSKPIAVVFEDDISPEPDFVMRLWSLVTEEVPCDWQAVSLSSKCPFGRCVSPHLTRVQPDVNEPAWRCRHGVNYGFQGMMYRTAEIEALQAKWKPVVFDETRPHCFDVDVALASISDSVAFYAVPAVQTPGFVKQLDQGSSRIDINFDEKLVIA